MSVFNQKCDECGCKSPIKISDDDELRDVRNKMKSDGWIFKHAKSYCVACAKLHPAMVSISQDEYDRLKRAERVADEVAWDTHTGAHI